MTRFSAPIVYHCNACFAHFTRADLLSFSDFGCRAWSDGRSSVLWDVVAPLVRCTGCTAVHWLADLRSFGEAPREPARIGRFTRAWLRLTGDPRGLLAAESAWAALPASLKHAERALGVEYPDLLVALRAVEGSNPERETYIRRRIWWLGNDRHRRSGHDDSALTEQVVSDDAAHHNMVRLLALLESQGTEFVTQGELLRQLGKFDEAVQLLKAVKPDGHSEVMAIKIQRWAEKRDSALKLLNG